MRLRAAGMLLLAACSGGRQDVPAARGPAVVAVELRLLPDEGRAWVAVDSAGMARGGHFSGGPAVSVYTDSARIAADSVRQILAAVRGLGDSLLARRGPAVDSSRPGTATIAVTFGDGTQAQVVWAGQTPPGDPRVRALLDHLLANRVGGW